VFRSIGTALVVLCVLLALRVPLKLPAPTLARALAIGLVIAVQSYCLYSSVARLPVALALLTFNSYPILYMLLAWATGVEPRPPRVALLAMPVALFGLALALDVVGSFDRLSSRWAEIGTGAGFAIAASVSFALVLYLSARWMRGSMAACAAASAWQAAAWPRSPRRRRPGRWCCRRTDWAGSASGC
jgi:drug/metabolite transporter (DMT)-like permease